MGRAGLDGLLDHNLRAGDRPRGNHVVGLGGSRARRPARTQRLDVRLRSHSTSEVRHGAPEASHGHVELGALMSTSMSHGTGTITIGADLAVGRIGYGAMQLTGDHVWGEYPDHDGGIALLRYVVDSGVTFIDTADVYGPHSNEQLIHEALHPYPEDLVIATKGGFVRGGRLLNPRCGRQPELLAAVRPHESAQTRPGAYRPVLPAQRNRDGRPV